MEDGRFMSGEFRYYFPDSAPAPNSSTRGNQYYDPVHESREWHLNNARSPAYITQIASTWATSPSLATYGRQNVESDSLATTISEFMSPMFLSNPELASIDTRRTQMNSTTSERNTIIPSRPQLRPMHRRHIDDCSLAKPSTQVPNEQIPSVISPLEVEQVSLQGPSRIRRRHRNQHGYPEVPNLQIPSNENILRREYGVAFGSPSTGRNPTASAIREAVIRRAMFEKRIPSKSVIASLETVRLEELEKNDRCESESIIVNNNCFHAMTRQSIFYLIMLIYIACIICYNEFGVANPEGIIELPLRLPKCKHIFGDKCIKKWFEDSDSCPYCRDKLPSETPLKKIYGFDTPSHSRDRLVALRRRIVHAQNLSRYISTVELTNSRIAQTMQLVFFNLDINTSNLTRSSNIQESPRNDIFRGPSSVLTSDDLQNLSVNRASATDSERRRCLQSRGISPRSANYLSRNQNGRSARTVRSNLLASPDPGLFPQMFIPLGSNLSGVNTTSIQNNTSPLRGIIAGQETTFQASPTNMQFSGHPRPSSSFPEIIPSRGITSYSTSVAGQESTERMNEILNELRNETLRTIEDSYAQSPADTIVYPRSRLEHTGFVHYSRERRVVETESPRSRLPSTSNWQPHDSRDVMSINSLSQNIHREHGGEDTNSEDLMDSFSQSPPQPVA
ncbi:RING-finger domain containing protein [Erysiphe neolycopersici]|uniref:RING-finger domain containing protein n=1 Tax=Erysiphe neolycopersici TaxID=212602 RepID=A0A420HWE8_9PEZI|nr:RING-finger domain containing protein [Erysiphe neolycopersici]